jgi:tetratricopeptide (TPR) repeat protein
MKMLFKAKYIILSLLFIVALLVGTKYGWLVQRYTFSKTLQNEMFPAEDIKRDLNRCLRTCDDKDKAFALRFLNLVQEVEDGKRTLPEQMPEMSKIISEATNNYLEAEAVKSAVEMYTAALALNDPSTINEVYVGIEKLAAKYPRNGHVYFALGSALFQKNPRDEKAMGSFRKCLLILPTESSCQAGYSKAVKMYTTPRCESGGISSAVTVTIASGMPEEVLPLSPEDIAQLSPGVNDQEQEILWLEWSPTGKKKLQEVFNPEKTQSVHLALEKNLIASSLLSKESLTEPLTLKSVSPPDIEGKSLSLFEQVCARPLRPELPKKFKL